MSIHCNMPIAVVMWPWLLVVALVFEGAAWTAEATGQMVFQDQPVIGGLRQPTRVVPQKAPRPAEGVEPGQTWHTKRAPAENEPVASFIDTLKGNDAALQVIMGQGRLLTTKADIVNKGGTAVIAVGDPTVLDFQVLPNPRMIRIMGRRAGVTDLSITTADSQTYSFEVHVVYDLDLMRAHLRQIFPDAYLRLAQLREHLVVEGEARSPAQVAQVLQTLEAFLESVQPAGGRNDQSTGTGQASGTPVRIINLIRVPGIQQVSLQVRVAELNRTGLREIGADILGVNPSTGNIFGTSIGGAAINALGLLGLGGLVGTATGQSNPTTTTAFGIVPSADFEILLRALRRNSLLTVLAEPNLITMSGHTASFLAGGEFPVPVPQTTTGGTNSVTIDWKKFGVQLDFVPYVLNDQKIRLLVTSEVSSIDESLGTTLVAGGNPVPGVHTRRTTTTVELREGQTLAIAGLLQVEIDGRTSRIPGLGDLPYIGPMFSNTTHRRVEKELLVLVSPRLVSPMDRDQVPPVPGAEVQDPNDLEFYLLNRIEGRTGRNVRSTLLWDKGCGVARYLQLEQQHVYGPVGFSE